MCLQDEDEDWSRWRDVVFRAKGALKPRNVGAIPSASQKESDSDGGTTQAMDAGDLSTSDASGATQQPDEASLTEAMNGVTLASTGSDEKSTPIVTTDPNLLYCPECYLPLHPDPKPEKLYIFLHAVR